jgi:hypothetical protein
MPLPILQILSTGDGTRAMYAIRSATLKWKEVRAPLAASQKQDYPNVATAYAARRSDLAKSLGAKSLAIMTP